MRQFHGMIFLGSGEHSKQETRRLIERLEGAINTLGGLQQGGWYPSEEAARVGAAQDEADALELEDAVRDIAAALLGRNVEFTTTLPYPPTNEGSKKVDADE